MVYFLCPYIYNKYTSGCFGAETFDPLSESSNSARLSSQTLNLLPPRPSSLASCDSSVSGHRWVTRTESPSQLLPCCCHLSPWFAFSSSVTSGSPPLDLVPPTATTLTHNVSPFTLFVSINSYFYLWCCLFSFLLFKHATCSLGRPYCLTYLQWGPAKVNAKMNLCEDK